MYKVEAFQPDVKAWLGYAEVSALHRNIQSCIYCIVHVHAQLVERSV